MTGETKNPSATHLIEALLHRDAAIEHILADTNHSEHSQLKQSLIDIINGRNPAINSYKKEMGMAIDGIEPKAEHGPIPIIMKASLDMDEQIKAINLLAPLAAYDDQVYEILWKAARGGTSCMTNVLNRAIGALSRENTYLSRKDTLKSVALNTKLETKDRVLAYKVLAGSHRYKDKTGPGIAIFTDPEIYDFVCDIANDKDPEFQQNIFEVIKHILKPPYNCEVHNNILYMNTLEEGYPETSQKLTRTLYNLIKKYPSYRAQELCDYVRIDSLSVQEAEHIIEALENEEIKQAAGNVGSHVIEYIDDTIMRVRYDLTKKDHNRLSKQQVDQVTGIFAEAFEKLRLSKVNSSVIDYVSASVNIVKSYSKSPYASEGYMDRKFLKDIWEGKTTPKEIKDRYAR